MLSRIFTLFSIMVVISACSVDRNSQSYRDGVNNNRNSANNSGRFNGGIDSGELGDITPGSQEELVAAVGDRVFFGFNSADLSDSARNTLERQAQWLNVNPRSTIVIEGHCDERGTREYNLALGERRATSVKNYLINLGVNSSRVSTISYGKEHPEYIGSNEAAWSKNRRAVTVIN